MSDDRHGGDTPQFPDDHPLAGHEDLLDDHAGHLLAYGRVLEDAANRRDGDVEAAMVVLTGQGGTETLPTVTEDVDPRWASMWMLGAHISHVARSAQAAGGELTMEHAASHAIEAIREHSGPEEVY